MFVAAVAVVLAGVIGWKVVTASDTSPATVRSVGGVPLAEGAWSPPGSSITPWLRVPPDAVQVGPVFVDDTEEGWSASLVITGDPGRVASGLIDQAEAAGFGPSVSGWCSPSDVVWCHGSRRITGPQGATAEVLTFGIGYSPTGAGSLPVSAIRIDLSRVDSDVELGTAPDVKEGFPAQRSDLAAWRWPHLARAGEVVVGAELLRTPTLRVPDGAWQVAPLGLGPCGYDDGVLVLQVKGSPAAVAVDLVEQIFHIDVGAKQFSGPHGRHAGIAYNGGTVSVETVHRPGETGWVRVQGCPQD